MDINVLAGVVIILIFGVLLIGGVGLASYTDHAED